MMDTPENTRLPMLTKKEIKRSKKTVERDLRIREETEKYFFNEYEATAHLIDEVNKARHQETWTSRDVNTLRQAALLHIKNFRRILTQFKESIEVGDIERKPVNALLRNSKLQRDLIVVEILKGVCVKEAFENRCGKFVYENGVFTFPTDIETGVS